MPHPLRVKVYAMATPPILEDLPHFFSPLLEKDVEVLHLTGP